VRHVDAVARRQHELVPAHSLGRVLTQGEYMDRQFYKAIGAHVAACFGEWLYKLAVPILVFKLTGSSVDMAVAFALIFLPFCIFSIVGGITADLFQQRAVLIVCSFASFLSLAGVGLVL